MIAFGKLIKKSSYDESGKTIKLEFSNKKVAELFSILGGKGGSNDGKTASFSTTGMSTEDALKLINFLVTKK